MVLGTIKYVNTWVYNNADTVIYTVPEGKNAYITFFQASLKCSTVDSESASMYGRIIVLDENDNQILTLARFQQIYSAESNQFIVQPYVSHFCTPIPLASGYKIKAITGDNVQLLEMSFVIVEQ